MKDEAKKEIVNEASESVRRTIDEIFSSFWKMVFGSSEEESNEKTICFDFFKAGYISGIAQAKQESEEFHKNYYEMTKEAIKDHKGDKK